MRHAWDGDLGNCRQWHDFRSKLPRCVHCPISIFLQRICRGRDVSHRDGDGEHAFEVLVRGISYQFRILPRLADRVLLAIFHQPGGLELGR